MTTEDVTRLLKNAGSGDRKAARELMEKLYGELRRMAAARMRAERPDHTLQPTALVNEAYIRLAGGEADWQNRAHFFGAAAEAMRRVLVEHARKRSADKRGGGVARVTFNDLNVDSDSGDVDLLALDEALTALAQLDERLARVVRLRFFAGLDIEQTAKLIGTSPATVKRDWTYARAWLFERMSR